MVRARILLDVDGVLADFLTPCIAIINELTGWSKTHQDIQSWHVFRSLDVPENVERKVYERMQSQGWCLSLKPIEGAIDGVRRLREIGDVYFVTSPMKGPHWTFERTVWLIKHFGAKWEDVIHCSAKHVCAGDIFIDDKVAHLDRWNKSHPDGIAIKFESHHNRLEKWDQVMHSWAELPEFKFGGDRKWHP